MYINNFVIMYYQKSFIGVRGRVQTRIYEKNEEKKYQTEVVAEKVTFLSSKKKEEAE